MPPVYIPNFVSGTVGTYLRDVPWERHTATRSECFMAPGKPYEYTYGSGRGVRSYWSVPFAAGVDVLMGTLNSYLGENPWLGKYPGWGPMTGCFLNRYDDNKEFLGFHADNFVGMDHTKCVAVVSFGEPREIWWRENDVKGDVPLANRQLLGNGSLFLMPPGMQHTHQHRIPKGDRTMGPRVSLTYRAFK